MTESPVGLRERKKEKTRVAIKSEAFKLFKKQGFSATTVEQIAAAIEISPSTFFRYFPTKESVLIDNQYPEEIVECFANQPAELDPVRALHRAVIETFADFSPADLAALRQRNRLILATPELRAAYMEHLHRLMTLIGKTAARRTGLSPNSIEVRTFAWVMQGVLTAASTQWTEDAKLSLDEAFDKAFAVVKQAALPVAR
jgi:AcrR family transcriptional regulator